MWVGILNLGLLRLWILTLLTFIQNNNKEELDSYIFIYVYREREKKGHERGKYMNVNDYLKFREK